MRCLRPIRCWFTGEEMFASPLTSFAVRDFVLNVDHKTLESMKSFDADRWST